VLPAGGKNNGPPRGSQNAIKHGNETAAMISQKRAARGAAREAKIKIDAVAQSARAAIKRTPEAKRRRSENSRKGAFKRWANWAKAHGKTE
jgi:hypothetical protein